MSRSFEPDDKATVYTPGGGERLAKENNAEIAFVGLTAEVLRDIVRNESCSRSWRKAALKFLIRQQHKYQYHPEFRELIEEIKDEAEAEKEVQAIVESAIEGPLGD